MEDPLKNIAVAGVAFWVSNIATLGHSRRVCFMFTFVFQIWDAREKNGVKSRIPGPHVCGDALDIKVRRKLCVLDSTNLAAQDVVS